MTEARYRGQKVVVVSPDYADHTKFADHWLAAEPGTDAALAMAMAHVILKEHYVESRRRTSTGTRKKRTDLPFLVTLRERDGAYVADRFLRASDLGEHPENAEWKTVVLDEATGEPVVPNGSLGFRYGEEGEGKWNLELGEIEPRLSLLGRTRRAVPVDLARFDIGETEGGGIMRRGVPAKRGRRPARHDRLRPALAQLGVARDGTARRLAHRLRRPAPYTPAWQQPNTGGRPPRSSRGSPVSSRATPRSPKAAR